FQTAQSYPVGNFPSHVVVGDFDGNGKLDFAVTNQKSNTVSVLLGNGDGTFQAAEDYPAGGRPLQTAVGECNDDGIRDLAVANYTDNGAVSILLGNGNGTFQTAQSYRTGGFGSSSVTVADFSGDGAPDLAVVDNGVATRGTTVSILLG